DVRADDVTPSPAGAARPRQAVLIGAALAIMRPILILQPSSPRRPSARQMKGFSSWGRPPTATSTRFMLSTANISIQFGAKPLFEHVSVKFADGNRYGLIGEIGRAHV